MKVEEVMHLNCYEYEKFNRVVYDDLREFCLCERKNEEYIRTLVKKTNCSRDINIAALARRVWNFKLYIKGSIRSIFKRRE